MMPATADETDVATAFPVGESTTEQQEQPAAGEQAPSVRDS